MKIKIIHDIIHMVGFIHIMVIKCLLLRHQNNLHVPQHKTRIEVQCCQMRVRWHVKCEAPFHIIYQPQPHRVLYRREQSRQ